jgi:hypothetical protein
MQEREKLLIQREEFLKRQSADEEGDKSKIDQLKEEISKIE